MKYVMSWKPRPVGSPAEAEEATKRSLAVFSKWSPPAGVTFHQFVSRLDSAGGYAVVETDDPKLVAEGPAKFGPSFDFELVPVVDIMEVVPIAQEAIAFRDSVS